MESFPSQIVQNENLASYRFLSFNQQNSFPFPQPQNVDFPRNIQIRKSIKCARNKKGQFKSARSGKLILQSAYQIASKLRILPEPLDVLIREFGIVGGNGGGSGSGFWKGSGWGGFDGWGKKRKRRGKMEFLGILVISCLGLWLLMSAKEVDANFLLKILGLVIFGLSINGWKKGVKEWILGFCSCAVLIGLVFKKEDFQTLIKNSGAVKKLVVKKWKPRAF